MKHIIIFLFALCFCSCLSIEKNVKFNADGSGTGVTRIIIDKEYFDIVSSVAGGIDTLKRKKVISLLNSDSILERAVKKNIPETEGLVINRIISSSGEGDSKIITIDYSFTRPELFDNTLSFGNMEQLGQITYKDEGSHLHFRFASSGPDSLMNGLSLFDYSENSKSMISMLIGSWRKDNLSYSLIFPYNVISSNAALVSGDTLKWSFNVGDLLDRKTEFLLEADMKK